MSKKDGRKGRSVRLMKNNFLENVVVKGSCHSAVGVKEGAECFPIGFVNGRAVL